MRLRPQRLPRSPATRTVAAARGAATAVCLLAPALGCPTSPGDPPANQPPTVAIASPTPGSTFGGGDVIQVQASATDPGNGTLPGTAVESWVVLHHDTHTHPFLPAASGTTRSVLIPRTGHFESDIFYRIHVRAIDPGGLADTAFVDIHPRVVSLTLVTLPAGLQVTLDAQPTTTPVTIEAVEGMERAIGVPSPQPLGGLQYEFQEWGHGGAALQTIRTPAVATTFTARLREAGVANLPPTVAVTAPAPSATAAVGATVLLAASAQDPDGTVTRVEFFVGGAKVGEATAAPFTAPWVPTTPGPRLVTARATDNLGAYTLSAAVAVVVLAAGGGDVQAPIATLTAPAPGSLGLVGSVGLTATATDDVGVTAVEFDVDGVLLATATSAPYSATLPATAAYASGAHLLRARARDAAGNWSDWSASTVTFGGDVALPAGLTRTTWVAGFGDILTAAALAPDGRMFVAEQTGRLRVVKNGQLLAQPFITLPVDPLGERGLLGVAVHPDFATNKLLYLYYTTTAGGAHNRISRFVASGDVAIPGGEEILVDLPLLNTVPKHNGGAMAFGADGKLYVAVGDNSDGANAPSLSIPFGKMLRFNADGSIPLDNPFLAQTTGINRAIWARGLRNPFTFAIESGTGRIHINDVGAGAWEEINLGRAGADYGWPATEGPTGNPAYDAPILAYAHADSPTLFSGRAVVGAAFYRPATPILGPQYVGSYFFADYVEGWVYRMHPETGSHGLAFAQLGGVPTGLVVGPDGALYVLTGTRIDRIGP